MLSTVHRAPPTHFPEGIHSLCSESIAMSALIPISVHLLGWHFNCKVCAWGPISLMIGGAAKNSHKASPI